MFLWLKKYARRRFSRDGMNRYKNLQAHYKRMFHGPGEYNDKWLNILSSRVEKGFATDEPLVSSGDMKKEFLDGSYRVTRSTKYGSIRATWTRLGPAAKKQKPNQRVNIPMALTEITDQELRELGKAFNKILQDELNKIDKGSAIQTRLGI